MKRVMTSSCVSAVFLFFSVFAMDDKSVPLGSNHRRISSIAELRELSPADTVSRPTFTIKDYQELANKFYAENYPEESAPNFLQKVDEQMAGFSRLESVMGNKKYKVAEGKEIDAIDLSWLNMKKVFEDNFKNFEFEKDVWRGRAKTLKDIIDATNGVTHLDFSWTAIAVEHQNKIVDMCLNGEDSLFVLTSAVYRGEFRKHLHSMLENYTGFQRIMSLLAVSTLNSTQKHAFVPKFNRVIVFVSSGKGNAYLPVIEGLQVEPDALSHTVFHEVTHVYDAMIVKSLYLDDSFVPIYSALNSKDIDFVGLFFPMLTNDGMNCVVEKIKGGIDQKKLAMMQNGALSGAGAMIKHMLKVVIDNGLASLVFSSSEGSFELKTLTLEMLAKTIYIYISATVFSKDNRKNESIWNNGEEMLTMIGLLPISDGNKTCLVESRQNEDIYKLRQQEPNTIDECKNEYKKQFRFHSGKFVNNKDIATNIASCLNLFNYGLYPNESGGDTFPEIEIDLKPYFRFGYDDTTAAQK